jgi:hypothetical protein
MSILNETKEVTLKQKHEMMSEVNIQILL